MTGPKHSCGVVGFSATYNIVPSIHKALRIIQHRGQESAGISAFDGSTIQTVRGDGLVNTALTSDKMTGFQGNCGIGHVRYSTTGSKGAVNAQPLCVETTNGAISTAHNGDITNYDELRKSYLEAGWSFLSNSDSEVITKILGKYLNQFNDPVKAIRATMGELKGAYALAIEINDRVFGVRDPYAFRPLCIGKYDGGFLVASESAVIDAQNGEFVRDVYAGEIVEITPNGFSSYPAATEGPKAHCMFEWVYFARPDSVMDGREVYNVRKRIGEVLAKESPADVDCIMPVPDSGRAHALGYSNVVGIPYEEGFMKNRLVERTFILPDQKDRENAVAMKMNPIKSTVKGKRILLVDDSIVRGTTLNKLISMLRDAGAIEVHVRIGCPPVISPCYYGVDMKTRDQFIANDHTIEEIRQVIGADSLAYISINGLVEALEIPENDLCLACVNNRYPTFIPGEIHRFQSKIINDF